MSLRHTENTHTETEHKDTNESVNHQEGRQLLEKEESKRENGQKEEQKGGEEGGSEFCPCKICSFILSLKPSSSTQTGFASLMGVLAVVCRRLWLGMTLRPVGTHSETLHTAY